MLASYRTSTNIAKTPNVIKSDNIKLKEHGKGQPILPDVGQYVVDSKSGTKYLRGRLMGKVCIFLFTDICNSNYINHFKGIYHIRPGNQSPIFVLS